MPAFVKRSPGDCGKSEAEGTMVCCFLSRKKSRKLCLISADVMVLGSVKFIRGALKAKSVGNVDLCFSALVNHRGTEVQRVLLVRFGF